MGLLRNYLAYTLLGLIGVLTCGLTLPAQQSVVSSERENKTAQSAIEYKIGRRVSIIEGSKRITIVHVSVEAQHVMRKDMLSLARQLDSDLRQEERLRVLVFDDYRAASVWDPIHFGEQYESAMRGVYFHDRVAGKEYIQFSPDRKEPKRKITIDLSNSIRKRHR